MKKTKKVKIINLFIEVAWIKRFTIIWLILISIMFSTLWKMTFVQNSYAANKSIKVDNKNEKKLEKKTQDRLEEIKTRQEKLEKK